MEGDKEMKDFGGIQIGLGALSIVSMGIYDSFKKPISLELIYILLITSLIFFSAGCMSIFMGDEQKKNKKEEYK